MNIQPLDILGVPIHPLTTEQVLARVDEAIAQRRRLLLGVVNAAKLVNMRSDAELRESVLAADLVLADGMSLVWAGRLLGRRLPERVAGIDLMTALLTRGAKRGYRFFLLGATQEVLDEVKSRVATDYPGAVVAGARNGYYTPDDEPALAAEIAASRSDVLFVAMSSPKKERFLARWFAELDVPVCHGVGGSFDVLAGKVRRAPRIWQALGMEWLYRLLQEPGRLWKRYLITNTVFAGLLLRAMILRPFTRRARPLAGGAAVHEGR
ncbi:MAG: WecB/TagA/CpsF family glycosyltransferase [Phycisphaerae bacterium]